MFYLELKDSNLLHLTNGAEYSQFYFKDHQFIKNIDETFFKEIIQLNFSEKYSLMEMIGKGSFSKVSSDRHRYTSEKIKRLKKKLLSKLYRKETSMAAPQSKLSMSKKKY